MGPTVGRRRNGRGDAWLTRLTIRESRPPVGDTPAQALAMANRLPAPRASNKGYLLLTLLEYLLLIDWTGRQIVSGKRGVIPAELASIVERLGIDLTSWPELVEGFCRKGQTAYGPRETLEREAARRGRKWLGGMRRAKVDAEPVIGT